MSDLHVPTVTDFLIARSEDDGPGLRFERREWSWREHVQRCAEYASLLRHLRRDDQPFHVGVLLDNVPEYSFLLGASALSSAVIVGLNPQRRGAALAKDIQLTECQLIVTERRYSELLDGLDLGFTHDRVLLIDSPEWSSQLAAHRRAELAPEPSTPEDLLALIFTSGTGGDPKAVRCTHGKIAFPGQMLAERFGLTNQDGVYLSMPMFHSNALMAGWSVGLAAGATISLRRRFSASRFLDDIRQFGATYANYVGKPLSYILATPARSDDADNPLRIVYGNEGAERDVNRFAQRFHCLVVDGFGSTEGGIAVQRTPDAPAGSLGRPAADIAVLDPTTATRCPPAIFDADGRVTNPEEAIGELVNISGTGWFAGYYRAPEANAARLRSGMYWSGDLAYLDQDGFCYFVGRSDDWMRVDGENMGTAPIERVLLRHATIAEAAVYAVPDPQVGDQVMATIVLVSDHKLDPTELSDFLAMQSDLGPKQVPRFIRISAELPRTPTHKVLKRELAAQRWKCTDEIWWRPRHETAFQRLTAQQATEIEAAIQ